MDTLTGNGEHPATSGGDAAELTPPELTGQEAGQLATETHDRLDSRFKRRIALAVSLLALLGGGFAYAASDASIRASIEARSARQFAEQSVADRNAAATQTYSDLTSFLAVSQIRRRADLNTIQSELFGTHESPIDATRWRTASDQLAGLTPLLRPGSVSQRADLLLNDKLKPANLSTLKQGAAQVVSDRWGAKAGQYVGSGVVVGVAGALLGLALTVPSGSRRPLLMSAGLIAGASIVVVTTALLTPPSATPEAALQAVAEADRLARAQDYESASAAYQQAIDLAPDYAYAYVQRGSLHLATGSNESQSAPSVISSVSPEARQRSIADLDRALELDPDAYIALVNQGANYFHVAEFEMSEQLTLRALEINPDLPLPWLNLGLVLACQGQETDATQAYDRAVQLIQKRPLEQERRELYGAARNTLEMARAKVPSSTTLVQLLKGRITLAQGVTTAGPGVVAATARASSMTLSSVGSRLTIQAALSGLPGGSGLAWIIYYRPPGSDEWVQRTDLSTFETLNASSDGQTMRYVDDPACTAGGDFRVELFTGDRELADATVRQGQHDPATSHMSSSLLTSDFDLASRTSTCRPPTWSLEESVSGKIAIQSADAAVQVVIRSVPVTSTAQDRGQVVGAVLDRLTSALPAHTGMADRPHSLLRAATGTLRNLDLADGTGAIVWAAVGDDGWLRTVSVSYPRRAANEVNAFLARLIFA